MFRRQDTLIPRPARSEEAVLVVRDAPAAGCLNQLIVIIAVQIDKLPRRLLRIGEERRNGKIGRVCVHTIVGEIDEEVAQQTLRNEPLDPLDMHFFDGVNTNG